MSSRCSTLAALAAAAVLLPVLASAQQATIVAPNTLPPGLGSNGIAAPAPAGGRPDAGKTEGKPNFKELRLDNQTGALNSFVRVGPPVNGQGQGSAESRSSGSSAAGNTGSANERRAPELFKLGGNIKF